jgi:putative Ca2+/H+ antiporter (TMEM165/GDT1 family)
MASSFGATTGTFPASALPMSIDRLTAALSVWSTEDFLQSFCMISVAEVFDKTWFVALILAMKTAKLPVFIGAFGALGLHTIIAAAIGYTAASLINLKWLQLAAATLFFGMAVLYAYDWYNADPNADVIENGCADAEQEMGGPADGGHYGSTHVSPKRMTSSLIVAGETFVAVFIAEWGDRTQIAMFGQHASQPLMPVICGSLLAFALLTTSAVMVAKILSGVKIQEQTLSMIGGLSFLLFGFQSLYDSMRTPSGPADVAVGHQLVKF